MAHQWILEVPARLWDQNDSIMLTTNRYLHSGALSVWRNGPVRREEQSNKGQERGAKGMSIAKDWRIQKIVLASKV